MKNNILIIILAVFFAFVLWISVTLSYKYNSSISLQVKVGNSYGNYTASKLSSEYLSVKIRGTGWNLLGFLLNSPSQIYINYPADPGNRNIRLSNSFVENQLSSSGIEVTSIYPDTIGLFVEKYLTKKVRVVIDTTLMLKSGYGIASNVKIIPDSIVISGAYSVINDINFVRTNKIKLFNAESRQELNAKLLPIQHVEYNQEIVKVVIDVQQIVDKTFDEINIDIEGKPSDEDVVFVPNKISIGVSGGINYLGKLHYNDFSAYINYQELVTDTLGSVKPEIKLPYNVNLLFVQPERIKYIIKKIK